MFRILPKIARHVATLRQLANVSIHASDSILTPYTYVSFMWSVNVKIYGTCRYVCSRSFENRVSLKNRHRWHQSSFWRLQEETDVISTNAHRSLQRDVIFIFLSLTLPLSAIFFPSSSTPPPAPPISHSPRSVLVSVTVGGRYGEKKRGQ